MSRIVKRFIVGFVAIGVLVIANIFFWLQSPTEYTRTNQETSTTQRVFDYADKLTEAQEAELETKIANYQKQTNSDIVIVTLNESLEDYAKQYDPSAYGNDYTMIYADNFYEEYVFGYNEPYGNGVMLVDNWYREDTGSIYSWMLTSGSVYERYSSSMIDDTLNQALENVDANPYGAYSEFVDLFYQEMTGNILIPPYYYAIAIGGALVISGVVTLIHLRKNRGESSVTPYTYTSRDQAVVNMDADTFTHTTRTRVYAPIKKSSRGGGGGGGHISGGGHTFGGGGHSR